MQNAGLDESQAGIKIAKRNINKLRYADDTTLMAKWRGSKEPLDEGEKGGWKNWFETNIQKTKIMTSCPIISSSKKLKKWQILFSWALKSPWIVTVAMKLKDVSSLEEKLWQQCMTKSTTNKKK